MTEYDAIVYDLDGTLVQLEVDWARLETNTAADLGDRGLDVDGADLWELRELAAEHDLLDGVDEAITAAECEGARVGTRLSPVDDFPHEVPVGVCSLNAQSACEIALERHDIGDHVDVVVGRDTVETTKPDPEPLLHALEELDADPEDSLFVGDSESDKVAAERAGTDFQWVHERMGSDNC